MVELSGQQQPAEQPPPVAGSGVMLNDSVEIFPDRPLPELNKKEAKAYMARDNRAGRAVYAMICGKAYPPRVPAFSGFRGLKNTSIVQLVDAGVVDWPPAGRQKFAVVFDRPRGRPLMESLDAERPPMSEDAVMHQVVQPVMRLISDMRDADLVHGHINVMNIYGASTSGEPVTLGEGISTPPALAQPVLFETIERGMAQETGRGTGTIEDDLYAFGVCIALLMTGRNPLKGKTNTEITMEKLDKGSYGAVLGGERVPGGINEFLRGVLNDDMAQRWNVDEALKWFEGRRLSPKQPQMKNRAARPLDFKGVKYWRMEALALALGENPDEAIASIEDGEIEQWLKRSVEDERAVRRFEWALESSQDGGSSGYHERLVSRVCMALDPGGPIRYRGYMFFPHGIGAALCEAITKSKDIQPFVDIFLQQTVGHWLGNQSDLTGDAVALSNKFENCRGFIRQKLLGYGVERTLYYLNPAAPCLSPILEGFYVTNPAELLLAYEKIADSGASRPKTFIDRHIAAFLSVREKRVIDKHLGKVGSADPGTHIGGVLTVYASIQKQFRIGPLPALTRWLGDHLTPVIDKFHSRKLREKITAELSRAKRTGDIGQLLSIIDNASVIKEDDFAFSMARMEYSMLKREYEVLSQKLARRNVLGKKEGREISVMLASLISAAVILAMVVLHLTGKF